jgi:sulfur carrier protein
VAVTSAGPIGTSGDDRVTATVNGEPYEAPVGTTIADLVSEWCPSPRGVAVAVDGDVVPRSTWGDTLVAADADVEIVTAAAGG